MPYARQSEHPEPLPRAAYLRRDSQTWARKPALEARSAGRLAEERRLAEEFSRALDEYGISNVRAAEMLGLASATVIRDLRTRKARLTAMHLAKLPPDVCKAILFGFRRVTTPDDLRAATANDNSDLG